MCVSVWERVCVQYSVCVFIMCVNMCLGIQCASEPVYAVSICACVYSLCLHLQYTYL